MNLTPQSRRSPYCLAMLFAAWAMLGNAWATAQTYQAVLDASQWSVEASPLSCRLTQTVPLYGDAVFEFKAGEAQSFFLKPYQPSQARGEARLEIVAPAWHRDVRPRSVGSQALRTGEIPVRVSEAHARRFLAELEAGLFPSIVMSDPNRGEVRVDVSSVNFKKSLPGYQSCVAALYPANFDQLKASRLNYRNDQWKPDDAIIRRLDLLVGYMALDSSVKKIFVDGHSDRVGRQGHNWEISRLRANAVKDYLIGKGIPAENIVMRYYGETRLAVKTKNNVPVQANRRVIVQLVKG